MAVWTRNNLGWGFIFNSYVLSYRIRSQLQLATCYRLWACSEHGCSVLSSYCSSPVCAGRGLASLRPSVERLECSLQMTFPEGQGWYFMWGVVEVYPKQKPNCEIIWLTFLTLLGSDKKYSFHNMNCCSGIELTIFCFYLLLFALLFRLRLEAGGFDLL
jgi:hypothetical protein